MKILSSKKRKAFLLLTLVLVFALSCSVVLGYSYSEDEQLALTAYGKSSMTINGVTKELGTKPGKLIVRNGKVTLESAQLVLEKFDVNLKDTYPLYIQTSLKDNQNWENTHTQTLTNLLNYGWSENNGYKSETVSINEEINVGNATDLYVRGWLGKQGQSFEDFTPYWHFELTHVQEDKPANSPKTDDYASPVIYTAMAILSLITVAFILYGRRKEISWL